jgi:hypothetical protein
MHPLEKAARMGAMPPDLLKPVWQWGTENVYVDDTSNFKGLWSHELTPYVRQPMEDYVSDSVTELTCMAASQVAKTQPFLICLCWSIVNDPAPTLWVSSTEPVLEIFAKARLWPTFQRCKPVAERLPRTRGMPMNIHFPNMLFSMASSESDAELQSTPYRRILLDEVRNYKAENFAMVQKRTRTYTWNKMQVILSCPSEENDAVHQSYMAGDRNVWFIQCPACKVEQQLKFRVFNEVGTQVGGFVWDVNEKTRPTTEYDYNALLPTVRWKCPHCGEKFKDEPWIRRHFLDKGRWMAQNPLALSTHRSYHWHALLPVWVTWESVCYEFLEAQQALRWGDITKLKEWMNQTMGEPWVARSEMEMEIEIRPLSPDAYKMGDPWEDEEYRFLTIDVQRDHFWWVARQWSNDGRSRLLGEGGGHQRLDSKKPCISYDDLRHIQDTYKIPNNWVAIDCGFNRTDVIRQVAPFYDETIDSTWLAVQGAGSDSFMHRLENGESVRRTFSQETLLDAWAVTENERKYAPVPYYLFADKQTKDLMESLRKSGAFTIATDASAEYKSQKDGEVKTLRTDTKGRQFYEWVPVGRRGNHLFDCEKMQCMFASMAFLVGNVEPAGDEERPKRRDA